MCTAFDIRPNTFIHVSRLPYKPRVRYASTPRRAKLGPGNPWHVAGDAGHSLRGMDMLRAHGIFSKFERCKFGSFCHVALSRTSSISSAPACGRGPERRAGHRMSRMFMPTASVHREVFHDLMTGRDGVPLTGPAYTTVPCKGIQGEACIALSGEDLCTQFQESPPPQGAVGLDGTISPSSLRR